MVNADLISNTCKNEHSDIQIQSMIRAYTHCYTCRKYDQQHVQKHTKLFTDTNHTIRSTFVYTLLRADADLFVYNYMYYKYMLNYRDF